MGIAERKESEKKKMRSRILHAAMKLFLEKGFENVTIRRIAERIEYSPATIYLYFKNKDDILYALYREGFEELYRRQQAILTIKDPLKRLRKHGEVYLSFALDNPEYYDLMFIMRGPIKKIKENEEWEMALRSYEFLKENIKDCVDTSVIRKAKMDVITFSLWSCIHGVASLIIRDRCIMFSEEQLLVIVEAVFDFILNSISQRKK